MKINSTNLHKVLIAVCVSLITMLTTSAQIQVQAKSAKKEFLAFEKAQVTITITNRAGQPIQFKNTRDARWIEFVVEKNAGDPIHAAKMTSYKAPSIATGRSVTSTFTINTAYDLSQPGNYSAYAIVRLPGQSVKEGFRSNKVFFSIVKGFVTWKQKAGVPGTAGDTREYRLINVSGRESSELYVQIEDVKRGKMIVTYSMGRNLNFRKFTATLDNQNNLHVLFLTTPTLHCHTVVNTAGKTVRREYHKKGPSGLSPSLITTKTGIVGIVNSTVFNPEKIQEQRRQIHNLSEIPVGM